MSKQSLVRFGLGLAALLGGAGVNAAGTVQSTFATDTEGWLLFGDATTSVAACLITSASAFLIRPNEWLTVAAARLIKPMARMKERGNWRGLIGKFSMARAVCTP